MLHQVLRMVENAQGPVTLNELSRKLMVEPAVLESMIQFWVRKGRLVDEDAAAKTSLHYGELWRFLHGCSHLRFRGKDAQELFQKNLARSW